MENAAKALLIGAGFLVGMMVISLIMIGHRQISSYYTAKEEAKEFQQLDAFNKQYTPYNRDDVRGSDLISLINKIIDFNTLNPEDEKITISVYIPNNSTSQTFYYKYGENKDIKLVKLDKTYTQDNINEILTPAISIESQYSYGMATKLAANISTLMGDNSRKTKEQLLRDLKINYTVDNNLILKYYQYQQFKRAHFNCTNLTFTNQGRIKSLSFRFNGKFE